MIRGAVSRPSTPVLPRVLPLSEPIQRLRAPTRERQEQQFGEQHGSLRAHRGESAFESGGARSAPGLSAVEKQEMARKAEQQRQDSLTRLVEALLQQAGMGSGSQSASSGTGRTAGAGGSRPAGVDGAQGAAPERMSAGGAGDEEEKLKMLLRALMRTHGVPEEEIQKLLGAEGGGGSVAAEYMRDSFTSAGRGSAVGGSRGATAGGARGR